MWAFFDESGKLADSEFLCLCGYIAGDSDDPYSWAKFSKEWGDVLREEGLPFLHTTTLFSRRPPYERLGWNNAKINDVLAALSRVISRNVAAGFGVAMDARHYRQLPRERRRLIGDTSPELFLFHRLMRNVVDTLDKWGHPDPISLTFDWAEDFASACLKPLANLVRNRADIRKRISSIGFGNDEQYYPLQAADMLCYGTKLRLQGVTEPFYKILTEGETALPPVHYASEYWDAAAIDKLCGELQAKVSPSVPPPALLVPPRC